MKYGKTDKIFLNDFQAIHPIWIGFFKQNIKNSN